MLRILPVLHIQPAEMHSPITKATLPSYVQGRRGCGGPADADAYLPGMGLAARLLAVQERESTLAASHKFGRHVHRLHLHTNASQILVASIPYEISRRQALARS